MPMKLLPTLLAAGAILAPVALAAIEPLDLRKMLQRADSAVLGKIVQRTTWTHEDPTLGPMEFTTITVKGEDLITGNTGSKQVTYTGSQARPNSEMPAESETREGNTVLVFSSRGKGFGMPQELSWMVAAHGGVFRVEAGPKGDVVIGRGEGYAVEGNLLTGDLRQRITKTLAEIRERK